MARTRKTFPCSQCTKVFDRQSRLQKHLECFHVSYCPLCNESFKSSDTLTKHVQTCNEMEQEPCDADSASPSILTQEVNRGTPVWEALPASDIPFPPADIPLTSTTPDCTKGQAREIMFRCYICKMETTCLDEIKYHMRLIHKETQLVFNELE